MDIDKELNDSLSFIQDKIQIIDGYDIEYPFLDIIWLKYFLSIDLTHRRFLIQKAFKNHEFEGKSGLFTLE